MPTKSGYKTITPIQLSNIVWALEKQAIDMRAVRVYLACFGLLAVREAAKRSRGRRQPPRTNSYLIREVERFTGLSNAAVKRGLRELKTIELVSFGETNIELRREAIPGSDDVLETLACKRSPKRPIPAARSMLRFLARNRSEALFKTVVAYLVRGLSMDKYTGEIRSKGTLKASWIGNSLGLSARAVKYAQAELRSLGWISKDTSSIQRKLNRDGAYFVINLEWGFSGERSTLGGRLANADEGLVNRDKQRPEFAPPGLDNAPIFAPPIEDMKTSIESKNQETWPAGPTVAGVFGKVGREEEAPTLKNIQPEDLFHFRRLEELYLQAAKEKWIQPCEASALDFIAAAVRAREVGRNPASLFASLVRRKLWKHITQAQEEHARRTLSRHRLSDENCFRFRLDEENHGTRSKRGSQRRGVGKMPTAANPRASAWPKTVITR